MKKNINAAIVMIATFLSFNAQAQMISKQPTHLDPKPPVIEWHKETSIFLDRLTVGATYTVSCDIANPNYKKKYPVIIKMTASIGTDPKIKFIVNDIQPKYRQALLNKSINKYLAIRVSRTLHQEGVFLYIMNYDNSDPIYISNCIATQMM